MANTEPLKKVAPGDRLELRASDWNAFIDAANFARSAASFGSGGVAGFTAPAVLIRNATGNNVPRYSVLAINGLAINTPAADDTLAQRLVLSGIIPTGSTNFGRFGVTLQPAGPGDIVAACLNGLCCARIESGVDIGDHCECQAGSHSLKKTPVGSAQCVYVGPTLPDGGGSDRRGVVQLNYGFYWPRPVLVQTGDPIETCTVGGVEISGMGSAWPEDEPEPSSPALAFWDHVAGQGKYVVWTCPPEEEEEE